MSQLYYSVIGCKTREPWMLSSDTALQTYSSRL